ncbi:hypothetical protein SDC9_139820 [bioreactor metagenome]|uniref:LysR substrate-binding domain-containing protein n=1 Tax=bioreactor metagenome TaxID=1076179 RepID=A0A645DTS9_9ZZZZ
MCSPALAARQRDFSTPHQHKNICLLIADRKGISFVRFARYLAEKDIVMDNILELSSIEAIKRSAMSNLGVTILPRFAAEHELEAGLLEEIDTHMQNKTITAVYAYHKNKWISSAMERLISLLKENI